MSKFKCLEIKLVRVDPNEANYEFYICRQTHLCYDFGDDDSDTWTHNGFELKSIGHPEVKYNSNTLFVRGYNPSENNIPLVIKAPIDASLSTLKAINLWFTKMLNTIDAYNDYYSNDNYCNCHE